MSFLLSFFSLISILYVADNNFKFNRVLNGTNLGGQLGDKLDNFATIITL